MGVEVADHGVHRQPGYSSARAVAASHRVVSLTSRGTNRSRRPLDCMASSSSRDLSHVPAPSSTRVSASELWAMSLAWASRMDRSARVG